MKSAATRSESLYAWTNRDRDHVLLQPLVVAYARVATRGQHVDEAVLCDYLYGYAGVCVEKAGHDCWRHKPGGADRHVQLERAAHPLTQVVDSAQCRCHLFQRWREPLEQAGTSFGRRHALLGSVKQADAERRLQPAHRVTQRGRADTCLAWRLAKAAGACHGQEGARRVRAVAQALDLLACLVR